MRKGKSEPRYGMVCARCEGRAGQGRLVLVAGWNANECMQAGEGASDTGRHGNTRNVDGARHGGIARRLLVAKIGLYSLHGTAATLALAMDNLPSYCDLRWRHGSKGLGA
jgi:hypothetical protein